MDVSAPMMTAEAYLIWKPNKLQYDKKDKKWSKMYPSAMNAQATVSRKMQPLYHPNFLLGEEVMKDTEMIQLFEQNLHTLEPKILVRNVQY